MLPAFINSLRNHTKIAVDNTQDDNLQIETHPPKIERFFSNETTLAEIDSLDFLHINEEMLLSEIGFPSIESLSNLRINLIFHKQIDEMNHENVSGTTIEIYDVSLPDGSIQTSSLDDNLINGYGKVSHPNGTIEEGFFINGELDAGKITHISGETQTGFFSKGLLHGKGIRHTPENGKTYTGNFENGHLNGIGKLRSVDGTTSKGVFKNNELNGFGVLAYPNGGKMKGTFIEDCPEGEIEIISIEFINKVPTGTTEHVMYQNGCPIKIPKS